MPNENTGLSWGSIIGGFFKLLAAIGSGIMVFLGLKKATATVDYVNANRPEGQKITPAQSVTYHTSIVGDTCQKFGRAMTGASMMIEAFNSIINPVQPSFGNGSFDPNGCMQARMLGMPITNPLNAWMSNGMSNAQQYQNNLSYQPQVVNQGNGTYVTYYPDGSHKITTPTSEAFVTGCPWQNWPN